MIFATVGTQLPFPRMMQALSDIAPRLDEPIIAQTGKDTQSWPDLDSRASLTPTEYKALFQKARVIVAHAGIGTILSAKRWKKPLIILPRKHSLNEHRNDHQLATARQMERLSGIHVAWEIGDLEDFILETDLEAADDSQSEGTQRLIQHIRNQL